MFQMILIRVSVSLFKYILINNLKKVLYLNYLIKNFIFKII